MPGPHVAYKADWQDVAVATNIAPSDPRRSASTVFGFAPLDIRFHFALRCRAQFVRTGRIEFKRACCSNNRSSDTTITMILILMVMVILLVNILEAVTVKHTHGRASQASVCQGGFPAISSKSGSSSPSEASTKPFSLGDLCPQLLPQTHTHVYLTYIHTYVRTYLQIYMHTYKTPTYVHTHLNMYVCMYVCMHV